MRPAARWFNFREFVLPGRINRTSQIVSVPMLA